MEARMIADTAIPADAFTRGAVMKRGMLRLESGVLSADEFASRIGILTADLEAQPLL